MIYVQFKDVDTLEVLGNAPMSTFPPQSDEYFKLNGIQYVIRHRYWEIITRTVPPLGTPGACDCFLIVELRTVK